MFESYGKWLLPLLRDGSHLQAMAIWRTRWSLRVGAGVSSVTGTPLLRSAELKRGLVWIRHIRLNIVRVQGAQAVSSRQGRRIAMYPASGRLKRHCVCWHTVLSGTRSSVSSISTRVSPYMGPRKRIAAGTNVVVFMHEIWVYSPVSVLWEITFR